MARGREEEGREEERERKEKVREARVFAPFYSVNYGPKCKWLGLLYPFCFLGL